MKKTLNVNIGSMAFVLDDDAYYMLRGYLDDVASRVEWRDRAEVLADVEARIAKFLDESLNSQRQVVDVAMVESAIAQVGKADTFGQRRDGYRATPEADIRRLMRSRHDRVIGGVCGGLAQYFGIDVALIRVLMFLSLLFGGIGFWLYVILWIVVPSEPEDSSYSGERKH